MVFTLKTLIDACVRKRGRLKHKDLDKRTVYEELWRAVNEWMQKRFLTTKKGLRIAQLGEWNWESYRAFVGKVGHGSYKGRRRPFFQLSDQFARTYRIQLRKAVKPPKLAKCEELNISKIAIKFSTMLSKDMVFSGLRDIVTRIGEAVTAGQEVAIAFCLGVLHSKDRRITFQFDPQIMPIPRQLGAAQEVIMQEAPQGPALEDLQEREDQEEASQMGGNYGGDAEADDGAMYASAKMDDDAAGETFGGGGGQSRGGQSFAGSEFGNADRSMRRPSDIAPPDVPELGLQPATDDGFDDYSVAGSAMMMMSDAGSLMEDDVGGSQVEEEAYRRHLEYVQQMVEESAFEKTQFVQNLQNQELDARERRSQKRRDNKQLQRFLQAQVSERAEKTKTQRERDLTTKTHCSFPPLVHSAANGVPGGLCRMTSSEQQKRVRMRAALKTQMEAKANIHNAERKRQLEEERQFLKQVQDRMLEGNMRMQLKQAAVKKKLLQAWERDKKMKQLLQQGIRLQSTIRNDTMPTARSSMSNFSIGYDQRN